MPSARPFRPARAAAIALALGALLAAGAPGTAAAGTCRDDVLTITGSVVDPVPIYADRESARRTGALPAAAIAEAAADSDTGVCGIPVLEITPANMMRIDHAGHRGWVNPMFLETNFPVADVPACNLVIGDSHAAGTRGISKYCGEGD